MWSKKRRRALREQQDNVAASNIIPAASLKSNMTTTQGLTAPLPNALWLQEKSLSLPDRSHSSGKSSGRSDDGHRDYISKADHPSAFKDAPHSFLADAKGESK